MCTIGKNILKILSLCNGSLEWQFLTYIKKLDVIFILPFIGTWVIRQADDVRRQFITSDRIRKAYVSMSKCPSTKDRIYGALTLIQ